MTAKRALVVDDSRSARISLQKMLERYGIAVDFAESGEEALDYLKHHLVDAVFMDHTMPGMDGLETVVAIKSNPRTATVPVMMYTAKEGEVYVSQARALGAIGVLPKQVQPGVLEEMLRKLGLLRAADDAQPSVATPREPAPPEAVAAPQPGEVPAHAVEPAGQADRAAERARAAVHVAADVDPEYDQRALGASVQALITRVLNEQHVQLRSDILTAHRDFARQVAAEILARERQAQAPAADAAVPAVEAPAPAGGRRGSAAWLLLLPLLALGAFCWQLWNERDALNATVSRQQASLAAAQAELSTLRAAQADDLDAVRETAGSRHAELIATIEWALNEDGRVGFDEPAFDDRRAADLETLLRDLVTAGFQGTVRLESHLGEFCLASDADGATQLAAPGTPLEDCGRLGHPLDASTAVEERQSTAFASFMASSPLVNDSGIDVELVALDQAGSVPAEPMPPNVTTAGEWNDAASRNHRVRFVIAPAEVDVALQ